MPTRILEISTQWLLLSMLFLRKEEALPLKNTFKGKRSKSHEDDEIFSPPPLLILALLFNRCSCQKLDC